MRFQIIQNVHKIVVNFYYLGHNISEFLGFKIARFVQVKCRILQNPNVATCTHTIRRLSNMYISFHLFFYS